MSTPKWSIFDRLDELEDITLGLMEKAETTEPTLKDASTVARDAITIAKLGFMLAFRLQATGASNPRAEKNRCIDLMKRVGLNEKELDRLDAWAVAVCECLEKKPR